MRDIKKYIVGIVSVFLVYVPLYAQQDSTVIPNDSMKGLLEDLSDLDTVCFNGKRYINQRQWTPYNTQYIKKGKHWSDHLFIDISGGGIWMGSSSTNRELTNGSQGNIYIGKEFTSVHAMRIGAGFNQFTERNSRQKQLNYVFKADYLCNITSLLFGYKEGTSKRILDISAIAGLSYNHCTFANNTSDNAYGIHTGLQLLLRAGSNTGITLEPIVALLSDKYDLAYRNNRHKSHLAYGASIGMKYIFTDVNRSWGTDSTNYLLKNTFIEISGGLNSVDNDNYNIGRSLGSKYTISVGKWLTPGIGLKLSATSADNRWKESVSINPYNQQNTYNREELQAHSGARIEALINPIGFYSKRFNRDAFFSVNLATGGEFGWIIKSDYTKDGKEQSVKCSYIAFTGGLQFLFKVQQTTAFFFEPRITSLSYDIPYSNRPNLSKDYTDNIFSLNLGIRMTSPTMQKREFMKANNKQAKHLFKPQFYVALEGGTHNYIEARKFKNISSPIGLSGAVAIGYTFSPYLGIKMSGAYGQSAIHDIYRHIEIVPADDKPNGIPVYSSGVWERIIKQLMLSADIKVNLTNLYMGYDAQRRFNINLLTGPTFSTIIGSTDNLRSKEPQSIDKALSRKIIDNSIKKSSIGVELGVELSASITPAMQMYLMPKINLYSQKLVPNSTTTFGWNEMISIYLGMAYYFHASK